MDDRKNWWAGLLVVALLAVVVLMSSQDRADGQPLCETSDSHVGEIR